VTPDRTFDIVATVAELRARPGTYLARYAWVLELGTPFRWVLNSTATNDGRTVITSLVGGFQGAWLRCRTPDAGADLGDADATLTVGGGFWYTLPAATLTANRVVTLDPTNAEAGDPIEVTRLDTTAYTLTVVNGGPASGTLFTMPVSARSFALAYFNGSDFVPRRSGLML